MVNYVILFGYIGLQAKTRKNLRRLLEIFHWILNIIFNKNEYLTVVIGDFNGDKPPLAGLNLR